VIEVPSDVEVEVVSPNDVPGWDDASYVASRAFGDAWLDANRSALLQVPSVTGRPFESNVLVNPRHPDTRRLVLNGPFPVTWDERLLNP
jgi:RES domain-containing protein